MMAALAGLTVTVLCGLLRPVARLMASGTLALLAVVTAVLMFVG
jgi:hypothetical protein